MKIINLGEIDSILTQYLSELRDRNVQKESQRFRNNLQRVGELFAFEISKTLEYSPVEVETPLGCATCNQLADAIVISTLLRAGLPLQQGILNIFDNAECSFIATYRKCGKDNKFTIQLEYASIPSVTGKVLIIADTLVATGSSLILAYNRLTAEGEPRHTHIVCPIISAEGLETLSKSLPHKSVTLWVGAIDEEITNKGLVIPGMGDAGDLAFGEKR